MEPARDRHRAGTVRAPPKNVLGTFGSSSQIASALVTGSRAPVAAVAVATARLRDEPVLTAVSPAESAERSSPAALGAPRTSSYPSAAVPLPLPLPSQARPDVPASDRQQLVDYYRNLVADLEARLRDAVERGDKKAAAAGLRGGAQLATVQQSLHEALAALAEREDALAASRHEVVALHEDAEQLVEEISLLREEAADAQADRDGAQARVSQLEEALQRTADQVAAAARRTEETEARAAGLQAELDAGRRELAELRVSSAAEAEALRASLAEAETLRVRLASELQTAREEHDASEANTMAAHGEAVRLRAEHADALSSLRAEHADALSALRAEQADALSALRTEHADALADAHAAAKEREAALVADLEAARVEWERRLETEQGAWMAKSEGEKAAADAALAAADEAILAAGDAVAAERQSRDAACAELERRMETATSGFVAQLDAVRAELTAELEAAKAAAAAEGLAKDALVERLRDALGAARAMLVKLKGELHGLKKSLATQVRDLHLYSGNIVNDCMRVTVQAIDQVFDLNDTAFGWAEEAARLQATLTDEENHSAALRVLLAAERAEHAHESSRVVSTVTSVRREADELRENLRVLREAAADSIREAQVEVCAGLADAVQLMTTTALRGHAIGLRVGSAGAATSAAIAASSPRSGGAPSSPGFGSSSSAAGVAPSSPLLSSPSGTGTTPRLPTSPEAVELRLRATEAALADAKVDVERAYDRARLKTGVQDAHVTAILAERDSLAKEVALLRAALEDADIDVDGHEEPPSAGGAGARSRARRRRRRHGDDEGGDGEEDGEWEWEGGRGGGRTYAQQLARASISGSRTVPAPPRPRAARHSPTDVLAAFHSALNRASVGAAAATAAAAASSSSSMDAEAEDSPVRRGGDGRGRASTGNSASVGSGASRAGAVAVSTAPSYFRRSGEEEAGGTTPESPDKRL
jgi:trimeric autotransporter adhesin